MCPHSKTISLLVLSFPLLVAQVYPQSKISSALIKPDTSASYPDSLGLIQGRVVQVSRLPAKSTTLAMLLSAVAPGAGQIYTERYLHAPVVWGLGYYLYTQWKKGDDLYREYGTQYAASVALDTVQHLGNTRLRDIRDLYLDARDRIGLYIAIAYILNIVDAYVGASLYNFEVSDDLGGGGSAKLSVSIPLRK